MINPSNYQKNYQINFAKKNLQESKDCENFHRMWNKYRGRTILHFPDYSFPPRASPRFIVGRRRGCADSGATRVRQERVCAGLGYISNVLLTLGNNDRAHYQRLQPRRTVQSSLLFDPHPHEKPTRQSQKNGLNG